jgi:thiamine-monophosphate kinase
MREDELIERVQARLPQGKGRGGGSGGLVLGIGDDAAIYRPRADEDLVFTTDMMHEDRHFLRGYRAEDIGWKALCRGLSDIAAMGARPRFALLSLAVGPWVKPGWLDGFYDGFLELAAHHGVLLAGGDLGRAAHTAIDVVVCGSVRRGRALRRDGARAGDAIYVSGALGGGLLGLRAPRRKAARQRHLRPEPRIALGLALQRKRGVTAAMDVSDGLSTDLARLAKASGLAAQLEGPLPRFPGASEEDVLHGGDDYELLFTASPKAGIPGNLAGLPLTRIGRMAEGEPGAVFLEGTAIAPGGWDHFAR